MWHKLGWSLTPSTMNKLWADSFVDQWAHQQQAKWKWEAKLGNEPPTPPYPRGGKGERWQLKTWKRSCVSVRGRGCHGFPRALTCSFLFNSGTGSHPA